MEMINSIDSLRESLTERLNITFRGELTSVKPNKPMLIVYTGKNSYEGMQDVTKAMHRVWRNKTDAICQIMLEGGEFSEEDSADDCNSVNENNIHELVESMYSKGQNFGDLSNLIVVYVHSVADFNSIEEFKCAYANINNMKEILGGSICTGVSVIMMDESFKRIALSKEIRSYVREQLDNPEAVNRKTVLISNRTKKGELIRGKKLVDGVPVDENYQLLGNMLVMLDSYTSEFSTVPEKFFTTTRPTVLTTSYSVYNRPNRDICGVIINEILRWLENRVEAGENVGWDGICRSLEISGNTFPFLKQYYETKAKTQLSPIERLEYLPRMDTTNMNPLLSMPFNRFKAQTMGGFEVYYKDNYEGVFSNRGGAFMDDFRRDIAAYIREKIPAEMAINSLSEANIDNLMSGLEISAYDESAPASKYIEGMLYSEFWEEAKVIFREELVARRRGASGHLGTINDMIGKFIDAYDPPSDESVIDYYSKLTKERLKDSMGNKILDRINGVEKNSENILSAVYEEVCTFFDDEPIFKMSLEQELMVRMGGGADIKEVLKTVLINPLTENIRLNTMFAPEERVPFIMMNKTNRMLEHTISSFGNRDESMFLNTGDSNSMAILRFYGCDATTLL